MVNSQINTEINTEIKNGLDPAVDVFLDAQRTVLERAGVCAEERWVDTPVVGGRAHVLVTGEGPPVVLLNGIGVPAAMLAPLMARLHDVTRGNVTTVKQRNLTQHDFAQYAVDLPGYGLTDTLIDSSAAFTDDLRGSAVRFLVELFDGLGLDQPVIVANSLGSLWANWLAIDEPDRVSGLVHVGCPAIALDTSAPLPMRLLSVKPLGSLMMRLQPPSNRQVEQLSKMVGEHPLAPEIAQLILATERLDHFEQTFLATLNRLVRVRGSRPEYRQTAEQLAGITTPTLLVFANDDPMGGPDVGRRMAEIMPDAELHIVDGGHAPWLQHADQIAPLIGAFLDRLNARGGR